MDARQFLDYITQAPWYQGQIATVRELRMREAQYAEPGHGLPEALWTMLRKGGIERLYTHQAAAVDAAAEGHDFVVVTSTASGKTLCYLLPVFESCLADSRATALFVYPTKALAQDQLRILEELKGGCPAISSVAGTYDGDTPTELRRKLRDQASLILTNPDMLHQGILPNHGRWSRFFAHLRYVVLDEVHSYRGLFGSNVADAMRRLLRIADHYGAEPMFVCSSATIANPGEHAERLTGRSMLLIDEDGSPAGTKHFVLWNPPRLGQFAGRRSPLSEAVELMAELVKDDIQVIAFTRTRNAAERLYRSCRERLAGVSPKLAEAVQAYRGGYLPEERREIERKLPARELLGVASTNALELGIDIGSLDACIVVGYPGTIASTWQQAGRAGRGMEESVVFLIAQNAPVDQYLMHNPRYLFEQSPENAVIDPDNVYVALNHLRTAVHELPLKEAEGELFGEYTEALLEIMEEKGMAKRIEDRWYWTGQGYPAARVNLRSMSETTYTIMDREEDRVVGYVDEASAFSQVHENAVYLHKGQTYLVSELDIDRSLAFVEKEDVDYFTQAVTEASIRITERGEVQSRGWRRAQTGVAPVTVTSCVTMFKKVRFGSRESIGYEQLDLPPQDLQTVAWWVLPPEEALELTRHYGREPAEGLVGMANVLVEVVPLFAMCDAVDIGTVVDSANMDAPTLFVFDKYPQGMGFSEKAYELTEDIMQATVDIIHRCECQTGCLSCVGASVPPSAFSAVESGTRGNIPDKEAALILLHHLLELDPYVPKYAPPSPEVRPPDQKREARRPKKELPASVERNIRDQLK
ncbi:MAG: DEAD/DEAH box helicase [Candidatus Brocadiaceae bacterium]|jgi:DEAD/DEAH box helicase domain-containing protein